MPELSDFCLGSDVVASDGQKAGRLVRVLVEQDGFDPKALVVQDETTLAGRLMAEERFMISDEVVIPITAVESATHDEVRLSIPVSDVRHQESYLSYRMKPMSAGEVVFQAAQAGIGGLGLPNAVEIANKPEEQIEIDKDENVMLGKTGHRLGRVHDLLFDGGELIGVVIRPDGRNKRDVVLPIRFINRADDMALFADISASDIEQLKPFDA
jgi:sporulation protein YlmC with PRC-barrel domain